MNSDDLQSVADAVVRRAQQQGHVLAGEIRTLLVESGRPAARWKDVLARTTLKFRDGRYYPVAVSERARRDQEQQQAILRAVRRMVKQHRAASRADERRGEVRTDFIQVVKVLTEDGKEHALLSRDVSTTGIRLLGSKRLLGQKVRVVVPSPVADEKGWTFVVRILWTCAVGEDLFENGGSFLEIESDERS